MRQRGISRSLERPRRLSIQSVGYRRSALRERYRRIADRRAERRPPARSRAARTPPV